MTPAASITFHDWISKWLNFNFVNTIDALSRHAWSIYGKTQRTRSENVELWFTAKCASALVSSMHLNSNRLLTLENEDFRSLKVLWPTVDIYEDLPEDEWSPVRRLLRQNFDSFSFQDDSYRESVSRYFALYENYFDSTDVNWSLVLGLEATDYFHVWLCLISIARQSGGLISLPLNAGDSDVRDHLARYQLTQEKFRMFIEALELDVNNLTDELNSEAVFRFSELSKLLERPIVRKQIDQYVVPVPEYFHSAASDLIYYKGYAQYQERFSNQLGLAFERFIYDQILSFADQVGVEIYRIPADSTLERKRCDFALKIDTTLILIEAKISRLKSQTKFGLGNVRSDILKVLEEPIDQIVQTHEDILNGSLTLPFTHESNKIFSLLVLLEPFHSANSSEVRTITGPFPENFKVISAKEFEDLISHCDRHLSLNAIKRSHSLQFKTKSLWEAMCSFRGYKWVISPIVRAALDLAPWASF